MSMEETAEIQAQKAVPIDAKNLLSLSGKELPDGGYLPQIGTCVSRDVEVESWGVTAKARSWICRGITGRSSTACFKPASWSWTRSRATSETLQTESRTFGRSTQSG